MHRRPVRSLLTTAGAFAALLTLGCGADGPVMDLADLEGHELLIASYQDFFLHEAVDGVAPVVGTLHAVILPTDGEDDLYFNELREADDDQEDECFQLPLGTEVALGDAALELDLGGVQARPAGPLGVPRDACIRPQASLREVYAEQYDDDQVLELSIATPTSTWRIALDNPIGERRLERMDAEPVVEGTEVTFLWSDEREAPAFRDFRRGGRSAVTEVRLEQPGVPDVETTARWEGRELTIDLPLGVTGPTTVYISHGYVERDDTGGTAGSSGPSLNLDRELDDCPAARCRVQLGFALAPLAFDIQPVP
jgi:hypothetical protein